MRNPQVIEHLISGLPEGDLVHEVPAYPEAATQVVVALNDHYLEPLFRKELSAHQAAGPRPGYQDVAINIVVELRRELADDSPGNILLTSVAESVSPFLHHLAYLLF